MTHWFEADTTKCATLRPQGLRGLARAPPRDATVVAIAFLFATSGVGAAVADGAVRVPAAANRAAEHATVGPGDATPSTGHSSMLHLRYDNGCEADLEFDRARIAPDRLRAFARLLPYSEGSWDYEYNSVAGAGPETAAERLTRRASVVAQFEKEMGRLKPPRELAPLISWNRERWAAYEWRERSVTEFCQARNAAALERAYGGLDPRASCRDEIERATHDKRDCNVAVLPWIRCVDRFLPSGDYPAGSWAAFQRAYGIVAARSLCVEAGE